MQKIQFLVFSIFVITSVLWTMNVHAASQGSPVRGEADYILIEKTRRKMTLYHGGRELRTYNVSLGKGGIAPKEREGDMLTPEGIYWIEGRNPESKFHLSLKISYPSEEDRERARAKGFSPGGDIMIHGVGTGASWWSNMVYKFKDWTAGCVAVTNREIEEIWHLVPDGTPVEIVR